MMTKSLTTTCTALVLVGFLGACGSDDGSEGGSGSGSGESAEGGQDGQELYDWVDCMAGEGIELPEPSRDADGDLVIVGDGVYIGDEMDIALGEYSDAEFEAGADVCGHPPIRSGMSEGSLQDEEENALAFSQCMRENGIEDFPDPDFSDDESDGIFSPWPPEAKDSVESDPEFQAADETCKDIMIPGGLEPGVGEDSE